MSKRIAILNNDNQVVAVEIWNEVPENGIESDRANIGDTYLGGEFVPPTKEDIAVVVAPVSVSPRQIRQALTRVGLRPQVEAAVAAGDQDLKDWWEFSTAFERHNPQVDAMRQALGATEEQVDQIWTLGATL